MVVLAPVTTASQSDQGTTSTAVMDVALEDQLIAAIREAARYDNDALADDRLGSIGGLTRDSALSVALARRAAGVCGWLRSENDYARAQRLALRAIQRLASLGEDNNADHVERLYWEAWLEGYVLDDKVRALAILQVAAELAPDDPRISSDALRWTQALAEFGR